MAVEKTDPATGRHTIWTLDVARDVTSRLVVDATGAHGPVWSPDGGRVVFSSNRLRGVDVYSTRADGTGDHTLHLSSGAGVFHIPTDWSLDGRLLLYVAERGSQRDLWVLPMAPPGPPRPFLATNADESQGRFSPDVKWMAYTSNESGVPEVYVRHYPGGEGAWRVSTNGGAQPQWRRDGKELFYLAADGNLMAADVKISGSTFETGHAEGAVRHGHQGIVRGPSEPLRRHGRRPARARQPDSRGRDTGAHHGGPELGRPTGAVARQSGPPANCSS